MSITQLTKIQVTEVDAVQVLCHYIPNISYFIRYDRKKQTIQKLEF
jgi:hypothetical protein